MTLVERVSEWPAEWQRKGLEQGREQGLEQGREQGLKQGREQGLKQSLEHERALLQRMAATRFGAGVAERLAEVLARIADPDRLVEVGDWLVRCEAGDDFLARVAEPGTGAR